jgi:hypothetical protein
MGVRIPSRRNSATTSQPSLFGNMTSTIKKIEPECTRVLQAGFTTPRKIDDEIRFTQAFGEESRHFFSSSIRQNAHRPMYLSHRLK